MDTGVVRRGFLSKITGGTVTGDTLYNPAGAIDQANEIVNKTYVDAAVSGLVGGDQLTEVRLATTGALAANTAAGSGVGKTLTADANGALSIDSVATANSDRVLIKDEVTTEDNGVYDVTDLGSAGTPYILTRVTDLDSVAEATEDVWCFVSSGATLNDTGWKISTAPTAIDTDPLVWSQFSGSGATPAPDLNTVLASGNDAGAQKITNLDDPTAAQDAATKTYVDDHVEKAGDTMTGELIMQGASSTYQAGWDKVATDNEMLFTDKVDASSGMSKAVIIPSPAGKTLDTAVNDPAVGTGDWAIAFWIKAENASMEITIAFMDTGQATAIGAYLWAGAGQNMTANVRIAAGTYASREVSSIAFSTTVYEHVAFSWDNAGQTMTMYRNNIAQSVSSDVTLATITAAAGTYRIKQISGHDAYLDDIRIYDTTLSAADVTTIWNGGLGDQAVVTASRLAHYLCDEATGGTTLADDSGNANTLTVSAGTLATTARSNDPVSVELISSKDASGTGESCDVVFGDNVGKTHLQGARVSLDISGTPALSIDNDSDVTLVGELKIQTYSQNAEPTLSGDQFAAFWIDTDDSNRVYLLFRRGAADHVKIELV